MPAEDRVTEIEIALTHLEQRHEELSDVVREQARRIARLERRLEEAAEMLQDLRPPRPDAPPPHY